MTLDTKIIGWLVLAGGLFLFMWNITHNEFVYSLITMMCSILLWVALGVATNSFNMDAFSRILSVSGFLLAFTVFFMFGVEEMAYPAGAIVFHSTGIAKALGIGFAASIPLLILYQQPPTVGPPPQTATTKGGPTIVLDDDGWELADEEDLTGGEFDI